MSYRLAIGGRLRKGTSGVDRSQAALFGWGSDPVKEIGQTCDRSATVRPADRPLNRRMVTPQSPSTPTAVH